jgi:hypothetical protein
MTTAEIVLATFPKAEVISARGEFFFLELENRYNFGWTRGQGPEHGLQMIEAEKFGIHTSLPSFHYPAYPMKWFTRTGQFFPGVREMVIQGRDSWNSNLTDMLAEVLKHYGGI